MGLSNTYTLLTRGFRLTPVDPQDYLLEIIMADSTMVICKFHHRRVHRASFLGNLNTYPTRDNCWNVCGICHSRNSIRVHQVRLAVKKKLTPNLLRSPPPTQGKNSCGSSRGQ